jgi:acetyl-CoA synthetase
MWILGREDEVLKVAGHRIGTAELEDATVSYPGVVEAAVVGKKDAVKGEVIVVFARLKSGTRPTAGLKKGLIEHIRNIAGAVATPQEIHFVGKLPKTRSGKIVRRILRAVANQAELGDVSTLEDSAAIDAVIQSYRRNAASAGQ